MKIKISAIVSSVLAALMLAGCGKEDKVVLQVGHFPNISHAQALVAHRLSMLGKGWFEERLGKGVKIEWRMFNAGPSAMESMFTGAVDITYVGPTPAINAYVKTRGKDVRIISGSADGGAALVVNPDLKISKPADLKGKVIATPQLGNTQDVACRAWLNENGVKVTLTGGEATVLPTANPEQLRLFLSKDLDGVWTVEPWVSRIEQDAGGKVFLDQKDAVTTVLVASVPVMKKYPDLVEKFAAAHRELTEWINKNPGEAQKLAGEALEALTGVKMPEKLMKSSWNRLIFTPVVNRESLDKFVKDTHECGFIKEVPDMSKIYADKSK